MIVGTEGYLGISPTEDAFYDIAGGCQSNVSTATVRPEILFHES